MTNGIERRPFSELGDQQLLEQTRRLAADQRCIDVHMLDHLDEIDRRGLALRRGFSSLFDYAVRELRFSDAAAQRRIQAMRLCRRHGSVRACLQSGALSITAAGQLETTFAGAERAERAESARAIPGIGTSVRVAATIRTTIRLAEPGSLACRQRRAKPMSKESAGTDRRQGLHRRPARAPVM